MQIKPLVFQAEQNLDIKENTKKKKKNQDNNQIICLGFIWNFVSGVCRAGSQAKISG